jgi:hypothetical protein
MGELLETSAKQKLEGRAVIPVTVCTPTIPPREHELARAIRSVAEQTVKPEAHLIMVDVHREGAPAMLDKTIRQAETEWVAILADDDELLPHHLEILWSLVTAEGADIGFTHFRFSGVDNAGHLEPFRGVPFDNDNPRQMTGVFMAKKKVLLDVGGHSRGFDPLSFEKDESGHRIGEDFALVKRLAKAGARFAVSPEVTWVYHTGHRNTLGMPDAW